MTEKEREAFLKEPWTYFVDPFRIVGNLYFIGNKSVGSYLLKTEEGCVVIDTGYPITVPLLFESLSRLGIKSSDIKHIIHTHGHFDHFGATAFLKEFSQAKTYLGRRDYEMFLHDKKRSFYQDAHVEYFDIFTPDVLLDGGETLKFGDTEIFVLATPGHSDGCLSFFFDEIEDGKKLRCGLFGGAGVNTLTKEHIEQYHNYHSPKEFIETLDKLEKENVDVMVPNHTSQANYLEKADKAKKEGTQDPFIDKTEFKAFIEKTRKRFFLEGYTALL